MAREFPHPLERGFPHMGETENPQSSETGIPHLAEKEFPHPVETGIPHLCLVAALGSMNRIWLLTLLPLVDSVGFAIQGKNPGMMQQPVQQRRGHHTITEDFMIPLSLNALLVEHNRGVA
jgi:hypothetical protein